MFFVGLNLTTKNISYCIFNDTSISCDRSIFKSLCRCKSKRRNVPRHIPRPSIRHDESRYDVYIKLVLNDAVVSKDRVYRRICKLVFFRRQVLTDKNSMDVSYIDVCGDMTSCDAPRRTICVPSFFTSSAKDVTLGVFVISTSTST